MKKFVAPELEVVKFSVQDIINESAVQEYFGEDCIS